MTFVTHILLTYLGTQALHLQGVDIAYAYLFGVAIDFDHIIKFPLYFKKHKYNLAKQYNWRTSFQEPIALLWIVPLSWYLNTPVPIIFFIGHLFLDYLMSYKKNPLFPYIHFPTQGFFPAVPDQAKEMVVAICIICLNLLLK